MIASTVDDCLVDSECDISWLLIEEPQHSLATGESHSWQGCNSPTFFKTTDLSERKELFVVFDAHPKQSIIRRAITEFLVSFFGPVNTVIITP